MPLSEESKRAGFKLVPPPNDGEPQQYRARTPQDGPAPSLIPPPRH